MDADDFALADSFINFDYSPTSDHPPDPSVVGFGSEDPDPLVVFSGVEERFENFSLVENEVNGNSVIRGEIIANDDYENSEVIANDYAVNEMESKDGGDIIATDNDDAKEMATESGIIRSEITAHDDESDEIRGEVFANDEVNEMESESVVIRSEIIANDDESGEIRIKGEVIANDEVNEMESESTESGGESTKSDSESSSSGSESKEEYEREEGEIVDSDCDDSEDDDDRCQGRRSRNELESLPRVPPVNVSLGPHHKMLPVGVVTSIVGAQVIVEGVEKHDPLNEGSILWITERQTPLGLIDEIFGQVKNPYYAVRYNSENEVPEGIREGTLISFVAKFVNHVLNHKDLYKKGYDASGMNDEEVLSNEAEFSDDEKEAEYKRLQKQNKRGQKNQNPKRVKNAKQQVPLKDGFIPTNPVAPAVALVAHGHCPPIPGTGQGFLGVAHGNSSPLPCTGQSFFGVAHGYSSPIPCTGQSFFGATNMNPPFPHANDGPNMCTAGVWPNWGTLPPQQSAMCPENSQISQQLPMQGIPFQQQFNPSQSFSPPTIYPGGQPNMYADPMHAQGPINQNQWPPFPQFQAPTNFNPNHISGNQGGPSLQFNPPANFHSNHISGNQGGPPHQFNPPGGPPHQYNPPGGPPHQFNPPGNFHPGSISGNQSPQQFHQFNPGASAGRGRAFSARRGRRPFHRGGRGWQPDR